MNTKFSRARVHQNESLTWLVQYDPDENFVLGMRMGSFNRKTDPITLQELRSSSSIETETDIIGRHKCVVFNTTKKIKTEFFECGDGDVQVQVHHLLYIPNKDNKEEEDKEDGLLKVISKVSLRRYQDDTHGIIQDDIKDFGLGLDDFDSFTRARTLGFLKAGPNRYYEWDLSESESIGATATATAIRQAIRHQLETPICDPDLAAVVSQINENSVCDVREIAQVFADYYGCGFRIWNEDVSLSLGSIRPKEIKTNKMVYLQQINGVWVSSKMRYVVEFEEYRLTYNETPPDSILYTLSALLNMDIDTLKDEVIKMNHPHSSWVIMFNEKINKTLRKVFKNASSAAKFIEHLSKKYKLEFNIIFFEKDSENTEKIIFSTSKLTTESKRKSGRKSELAEPEPAEPAAEPRNLVLFTYGAGSHWVQVESWCEIFEVSLIYKLFL